ncbi:phytanoyl-CoA dioxygenase family protein [Planosporangium thailandense]|uniref:phytanoyl-CoA dioxygenase family protein n=1 Tax=Planosporangium thailandense TaxID=765197 RepID=UPI0030B84115
MSVSTLGTTWTPMSPAQRDQFERDGYLILPGALSPDEVGRYRAAVEAVYRTKDAVGRLAPDRSLHLLSAVRNCPELAGLIDHPAVFPLVWSILGWNVHVYHSHIDVHPQLPGPKPAWWHWHQDGGRQNRELETDPRPRISVKLAFWLSDVSRPGRGNLTLIPGSHRTNWLPGPPRRDLAWPQPDGAVQITVEPGDVVFFDRRIWHARSDNLSPVTRMAVFFGYTYRWIAVRDEVADLWRQPWWQELSPVQRQLLGGAGDGSGDHLWGHDPGSTPLYRELAARQLLDPGYPPLIP